MSRKNSPGAVAAVGRASAHIAKAMLELRQAERELADVRGLGVMGPKFLTDVGALKVLGQFRERLLDRPGEGLRLVSETPEEDLTPTVTITGRRSTHVPSVLVQEIPREPSEGEKASIGQQLRAAVGLPAAPVPTPFVDLGEVQKHISRLHHDAGLEDPFLALVGREVRVLVEQTSESPKRFEMKPWDDPTPTTSPLRRLSPTCPRCGKYLVRGAVGGGHFDYLECLCSKEKP